MPKTLEDAAQEIIAKAWDGYDPAIHYIWTDERTDRIIIECGYMSIGISRKAIDDSLHVELVRAAVRRIMEAQDEVASEIRTRNAMWNYFNRDSGGIGWHDKKNGQNASTIGM